MSRPSVVSALVTAGVTAGTYLLMHFAVAPRLPVASGEVPQLTGLTVEQARGLLAPRGLLLSVDGTRPDDKTPAGSVAAQQPLAGSHLRRGSEVHVWQATVPAPSFVVPPVAGLTQAAAREALEKAKLRPGSVKEVADEKVPAGNVISSAPAAGTTLTEPAAVELTVSSGPGQSMMPSVIGKRLSRAKEILEQAGFSVGSTRYGSHDDFDAGTIIKQAPAANTAAPKGAKVDVTINE